MRLCHMYKGETNREKNKNDISQNYQPTYFPIRKNLSREIQM